MNNTCGTCGGFIGDFTYSGTGAVVCRCPTSTPPTEDRDWKKDLRDIHSSIRVLLHGALIGKEPHTVGEAVELLLPHIEDFISQVEATAEARGYQAGLSAGRMESGAAFGKPNQSPGL